MVLGKPTETLDFLILLLFISLINKSIGRLLCLPFENPGPAEAGPCQKRASSRFEAGTSGLLSISDSEHRVPTELGQESQASSCQRKGTPLASRVSRCWQSRFLLRALGRTCSELPKDGAIFGVLDSELSSSSRGMLLVCLSPHFPFFLSSPFGHVKTVSRLFLQTP